MQDKIKNAFDEIIADDIFKEKIKAAVAEKAKLEATHKGRLVPFKPLKIAAAFAAILLIGVFLLYFTPTAKISIDINPSFELSVNVFGKVLSCESFNPDADELLQELRLKHMNYKQAVETVITSEKITALLSEGEVMTVLVVSDNENRGNEMLAELRHCTENTTNTECHRANTNELSEAHHHGLSYGKYKIYLEISSLNPDFTDQEAQQMTMRQLKELLASLSEVSTEDITADNNSTCDDNNTTHSSGHGHAGGNGNGKGQGKH